MRRQGCRIDTRLRFAPPLRANRIAALRGAGQGRTAAVAGVGALVLAWLGLAVLAAAACQNPAAESGEITWKSEIQTDASSAAAGDSSSPAERRRLRIVWGGNVPRSWHGRIRVRGARFVQLTPLGMLPDSAGVSDSPQEIRIRSTFAATFHGFDVELEGTRDAVLQFQLASREGSQQSWQQDIPLQAAWTDQPQQVPLDDVGSRLAISRAPADALGISLARDNLVFAPSEPLPLRVEPRGVGLNPTSTGKWQLTCRRAGAADVVFSRHWACAADEAGRVPPLETTDVALPAAEGVYDLLVELLEPSSFSLLRQERVVAARTIQLVVVSAAGAIPPAPSAASPAWDEQFALDPTRPERWSFRRQFSSLKLPQRHPAPLGEGARAVPAGERMALELGPKGWQVYSLPVDTPGQPHLIEIEYDGSGSIALGVSLLEENAAGQIPLSGCDVGVFIPHSLAEAGDASPTVPRWQTHRFVVWPASRTPRLALTNHDDSQPARIGQIRVLTGPSRLEPAAAGRTALDENPEQAKRRQRLLYVHRPNLGDLLGAPAVWDREQGMQLDDWTTIYTAADRLVQLLQAQGYDGLVLTVAAEGSAIYPSRTLAANPRWDNGAFFANGQDPLRKDVVELLYRLFDRAGLTLVPAIEFSGLLPELERGLEYAVDDSILLQTARGAQALVRDDPAEFRPPYNPLSPTVQNAVTTVVQEIATRGAGHPSYRGLAILVNGRSILALNADDWGCDQSTWEQFTRDVGWAATTSAAEAPDRTALLNEHRDSWLAWRSDRMTRFLERLGETVQSTAAGGELFLLADEESSKSGIDIATLAFSPTQAAAEPRPLRWGLPWDQLRQSPNLTCIPVRNSSWWRSPLAAPVPTTDTNDRCGGHMVFHQASWAEFAQLADRQIFPRHQGEILRLQQFAPGGLWAQSHFVSGLAESDPLTIVEGGWSLAQTWTEPGQTPAASLRALPAVPFREVPSASPQPLDCVVVRQAATETARYFYAANLTPWPVEVELTTSAAPESAWRLLASRTPDQLVATTHSTWRLQLAEFECVAAVAAPRCEVRGYRVLVPNQAATQLQYEIAKLKSKLFHGSPAAQRLPLANADFELAESAASLPDWEVTAVGNAAGAGDWTAGLDTRQPFAGSQALYLHGQRGGIQVVSDWLPGSRTGRVSITAAVRQTGAPQLELTLTGSFGGQEIARTRRVALPESTAEWQVLTVRFNDLPGELSDVRLRWSAAGSGSVWLDNLDVRDYWLDDDESKALKQLINLAAYKLNEQGDLLGCLRILEGYWPRFIDRHYLDRLETADADSESATLK